MQSKMVIFLKVILFFIVAVMPIYFFDWLFRSLYLTTYGFEWLNSIVDERVARSALGRSFSFVWGMITLLGWIRYVEKRSIRDSVLLSPSGKKIRYFLNGFCVQFFIILLAFSISVLIGSIKIEEFSQNFGNVVSYFIVSALIFSLNVFMEELIFRGFILQEMASIVNGYIACLVSTLLFMAAHPFHVLGLYGVITQAGVWGFAFAFIALYYNSIYVTFGIHLCNNLINNALFSSKVTKLTFMGTYCSYPNIYGALCLLVFAIFFLFYKRWSVKNI